MKTERISNLSLTTITRFTKEQLLKRLEEQMSSARYALGFVQDREILRDIEMDLRLAEIALASLTAEPALYAAEETLAYANMGELHLTCLSEPMGDAVIPLYTAPPASVSVPDALPENDDEEGNDIDYMEPSEVYALGRAAGWNACRAAMLQGSQPVSNRDELPVIGWLRSDYNSDDKRDPNAPLFMLGRNDPSETWGVKYIPLTGNSPVIPDGYVVVPVEPTMAMLDEFDSIIDYGAEDSKDAWSRLIAAAPQQEVRP